MKTSRQINAERKKEGKPPLNFALFRKVIKKLATTPEAYDQSLWGRKAKNAPCGTAACIAGWAAHLSGKVSLETLQKNKDSVQAIAAKQLGLDPKYNYYGLDEMDLFTGEPEENWPKPYRQRWDNATTTKQRARVAVAYLTHIIKTGKVLE